MTVAQVRLDAWSAGDLDLLRRVNAPEMTTHLGGPETDEQVVARHRRCLAASGPDGSTIRRPTVSAGGRGHAAGARWRLALREAPMG